MTTPIELFNTLSGKTETFKPMKGSEIRMYTCGPTVYDFAHIGNFRAYVFEDLLRRVLKLNGFKVHQVMNLTDVDDKTIQGARSKAITLAQFTEPYIKAFFEDLDQLRIERAEHYPRATEFVEEMIRLIETLLKSGHAYERDGSVYYSIKKFPNYGKLSKKTVSGNMAGARVDQDEYAKDEPCDFALWKKAAPDEPSWPASFGCGRPGWHIECSAMSMKLLGASFDIHTGGEDNIFPHHENEIAQSEGVTGKPFVRYWLHCRYLLVNNEKMSKSKGNFFTVRDILAKGHDPGALRYLLISHHYRQPLNFTLDSLRAAEKTVRRLNDFYVRFTEAETSTAAPKSAVRETEKAREEFRSLLSNDLNMPEALAVFFGWMNEANISMDRKILTLDGKQAGLAFLEDFDRVLAVFEKDPAEVPAEVRQLVEAREKARAGRDFRRSDELRDLIRQAGFLVEDTSKGVKVKKL
ncbi:MAG: cysteine--tRNA ligase [Candidatus Omnitrophica bacterium]|nr:cysteine--tRNA ligase [Candidatus Omnitrophota bacterium]